MNCSYFLTSTSLSILLQFESVNLSFLLLKSIANFAIYNLTHWIVSKGLGIALKQRPLMPKCIIIYVFEWIEWPIKISLTLQKNTQEAFFLLSRLRNKKSRFLQRWIERGKIDDNVMMNAFLFSFSIKVTFLPSLFFVNSDTKLASKKEGSEAVWPSITGGRCESYWSSIVRKRSSQFWGFSRLLLRPPFVPLSIHPFMQNRPLWGDGNEPAKEKLYRCTICSHWKKLLL